MTSLLGNVTDISSVIPLNWITLIKLAVMVMLLLVIKEVCSAVISVVKPKTGKGKTILNLAASSFHYFVVGLGIFWGLSILGVNLSTLFASVGILALIVGFGAEKLIADVVTGLFMIFENEYNVGDIIEVDGYRGTVSNIGVRTTSITDAGGNVKIFNNSDVRNITNLSSQSSTAVCDLVLPSSLPLDVVEPVLKAVMPKIRKEHPDMFSEDPSYDGIQALSGSSMTLRITAVVKEADRFNAARVINRYLKEVADTLSGK
jgi:small conductance mechanosensitive channel